MGSIVERVGKNVEKAAEIERQGLEQGEKDASEVREIKSIIDEMGEGHDEDITDAKNATRESAIEEATNHMKTEVHGQLEQGYEVADNAISEGSEQAEKSRQASADFKSVSEVSEFGRSTAESSSTVAEGIAKQFDDHVTNAEQGKNDSEDRYKKIEDDIMG